MMDGLLDVCTGIGSFSLAAQELSIPIVAQIEIDDKRREFLDRKFEGIPKYKDLYDVEATEFSGQSISIIAGGTPCPDFSISGGREGLDGKQSKLWYEYLRLVEQLNPQWIIWENVPGALSSNRGQDFLTILQGLGECGYHVAWRVLDAQYFGVPQQRRRIFIVGHHSNGSAAQVLFEQEGFKGGSKTRPAAWSKNPLIAGTLTKSASGIARTGGQGAELKYLIYFENRGFSNGYIESDTSRTLLKSDDLTNSDLILDSRGVRRLTPLECERLQGFPDNYTAGYSDQFRYEALGDSIAVPVSRWILNRINQLDQGDS